MMSNDKRFSNKIYSGTVRKFDELNASKEIIYESPAELLNDEIRIETSQAYNTKDPFDMGQLNREKNMIRDIKARYTRQVDRKMDTPATNILDTSLEKLKRIGASHKTPISSNKFELNQHTGKVTTTVLKKDSEVPIRRAIKRPYLDNSAENIIKSNHGSYEDLDLLDYDEIRNSKNNNNVKSYIKINNINDAKSKLHDMDINNRS